MEPGEIYIADFPEAGPHPVIIVSREDLNRGHYALVVVCTSSRFAVRSQLPSCVPFQAGQFGFTINCVAQCENILSIDKRQLIGVLDEMALREVIKAIGHVIESDCEPVQARTKIAPEDRLRRYQRWFLQAALPHSTGSSTNSSPASVTRSGCGYNVEGQRF